ncbi:MAG: hypothetical protein LBD68_01205 [Zoogloeaceae bacterium]|nr:hypothetical protein [Zoogloeaceae bacterium]
MLDGGLSAVYTFFNPNVPGASFGVYNTLRQSHLCRDLNLPYFHLGYWLRDTRKMDYKANFQLLESLVNGVWREFTRAAFESAF